MTHTCIIWRVWLRWAYVSWTSYRNTFVIGFTQYTYITIVSTVNNGLVNNYCVHVVVGYNTTSQILRIYLYNMYVAVSRVLSPLWKKHSCTCRVSIGVDYSWNVLLEYWSGMTLPSQKCASPPYPCSFHKYVGDVE